MVRKLVLAVVALLFGGSILLAPAAWAATVTATIPVGYFPGAVAFSPDGGTAYVVNSGGGSDSVSVVNVATNTVTGTIPVGANPASVAFSPDGTTAYVTNSSSQSVSVINVATRTVTGTIAVGGQPLSVAFSPNGATAYVANASSNTVSVVDVATGTVTGTIRLGTTPFSVAFSPNGSTAYVANYGGGVSVIDVATSAVTGSIPVGTQPRAVAFSPNGATVYVANSGSNTLSVIDVATGAVTGSIPVGMQPFSVAFSPNGATAYVANFGSATVSVIQTPAAPAFTASTPPATGTVGVSYSYTFAASGVPAPTFTVSSGTLPDGVTLSTAGVLSGRPTTTGTFAFTVTAANGVTPNATTGTLTVTVDPAPIAPVLIASTPPAAAMVGAPYSYSFTASGVPAPTFTVSSGSLPDGLTLTPAGLLSGTPTSAGSSTFTVTASNEASPDATTAPLTISVAPIPVVIPSPPGPVVTPLPPAAPAVPVSGTATFTG